MSRFLLYFILDHTDEISFKNAESLFFAILQNEIINRTILRLLGGACSELEAKLPASS